MAALALALSACGSDSADQATPSGSAGGAVSGVALDVLIASSGDAETAAVTGQVGTWATESGNTAKVLPAQDLVQQMGQGLAGGSPSDAFHVGSDLFCGWNKQGSPYTYGDQITDPGDFNKGLAEAFTADGKLVCGTPPPSRCRSTPISGRRPDADIPTDWDSLTKAAQKLTGDGVTGLVMGNTFDRVGAFMLQAGGRVYNEDATEITANPLRTF